MGCAAGPHNRHERHLTRLLVYETEYRTVTDLTNRMYFFELTTSPNVIWANMDGLDLAGGGPALAVDPYDETLVGDVTGRFTPREMAF